MSRKNNKKAAKAISKPDNNVFLAKSFYASHTDYYSRIPELQSLQNKSIAVFGLGCLGAPSVLEFTRAGLGAIHLVDYDIIDPGTSVRWPFGFNVAGRLKTEVLKAFINSNYLYTEVNCSDLKVGSVPNLDNLKQSQNEQILEIVNGVDLVYDCTAEWGVAHYLTDLCNNEKIPYIGISGNNGGWGGRVIRIRPFEGTGCWYCYERACDEGLLSKPPVKKAKDIQPVGCADPTFSGAGFDMVQIAIMGVKMAASTLCEREVNSYPPFKGDAIHIFMRNEDGSLIAPIFRTHDIPKLADCKICNGKQD